MLQEDRIPKIFISYAWGSSDLVLELAQRLVSHKRYCAMDGRQCCVIISCCYFIALFS